MIEKKTSKETRKTFNSQKGASALKERKSSSPTRTTKKSSTSTQSLTSAKSKTRKKTSPKTRIVVKCNPGFPNKLYLRGEGNNLSWDKGISMKNVKSDEWVWESSKSFSQCQFKVLINDKKYEEGSNHALQCGEVHFVTPVFS